MSKQYNIRKDRASLMDRFGSRVAFEKGGSVIMPIYCADDLKKGYIFSKQKHERLFQRVAEARMDKEWLDRVRNIWWGKTADEILKDNPGLKQLVAIRERLLEFGGDAVCMPYGSDEDTPAIYEFGQLWSGISAKMMKGQPSMCHTNACELWALNKKDHDVHICTGYALSEDGMWREHSWLIKKTPRSYQLIETTKKRLLYYGYVLDDYRATDLYYDQINSLRLEPIDRFEEPKGYADYIDRYCDVVSVLDKYKAEGEG